jgi:hypothetical protein
MFSHKAATKMSTQGLSSHLKAWLWKDPLPRTLGGCWQFSVPCVCQPKNLHSSLHVGLRLLSVPCHTGLSTKKLASLKYENKEGNRVCLQDRSKVLWNLTMEVALISHYCGQFCCLNASLWDGDYTRVWIPSGRIIVDHLRSQSPHTPPPTFTLLEYRWEDQAQSNISIWNQAMWSPRNVNKASWKQNKDE